MNQFVNNILIILVGAIISIVLPKFFKRNLVSIRDKIKYSGMIRNQYIQNIIMFIQKNESITRILKLITMYSIMAYFVTMQQAYSLLKFGDENNYVVLIISIFTVYGIFYTFIQFALNYILQSGKDRYWGRSKIKTLLMESLEYRLFNSNEFKILLIISALIPILKETIYNNPYLSQYYNIIISIFCVSLGAIYVLYTLLFIKSLDIMMDFFNIQEGNDFWLKWYMEKIIKDEYKMFFNHSYQNIDDLFLEHLLDDLSDLKEKERVDMFIKIFYDSISDLEKKQDFEIEQMKSNKNVNSKIVEEFKERVYFLEKLFINLWEYIEENIELDFDYLLNLYRLQDKVLFKQRYIANGGNHNEIEKEICNDKIYFKVPNIIWNKAININDIHHIHKFVKNREIDGKMLREYFCDSDNIELNKCQKIILDEYCNYIRELLNKCKELQSQIKQKDLLSLLGSFSENQQHLRINREIQKIIYSYIVELECSSSNKEFIGLLLKSLDDMYTTIIILYMMLYTGGDSYSKWKNEVLFLRTINNNNYYYEYIMEEENVDFICETISKSYIGHKISNDLIKWIIHNINNKIVEDTIQECMRYKHFTYTQLIKLKFIFDINNNYFFDFQNIMLNDLLITATYDWRMGFLREILLTPSLLKEDFFCRHQSNFFEYILQPIIPKELYEAQDFRMIYINSFIKIDKIQFLKMINEKYFLRKGIFEYFILKINDEAYKYLLSNNKILKIFISKIKEIIDSSNVSVESYLNNLVEKANECSCDSISDYKKNSILHKLNNLIY